MDNAHVRQLQDSVGTEDMISAIPATDFRALCFSFLVKVAVPHKVRKFCT
jgi:hypothetical protein